MRVVDVKILNGLNNKATLIAPSRRLSASLGEAIYAHLAKTQSVFETPPVYALNDWMHALWDQYEIEGETNKVLLQPLQSLLRFEYIISHHPASKGLLRPHQAAKTALLAWENLHHWQSENIIFEQTDNIEEATFGAWAREYQAWLIQNNALDETWLIKALLSLLSSKPDISKRISKSTNIILYGFEELSPLMSYFFDELKAFGWEIDSLGILSLKPKNRYRRAFTQKEHEYKSVARFAKNALEKNETVGIIVPNLADERTLLHKVFTDEFAMMSVLNPCMEICPHFNISAAIPLIHYPLVTEAINLLKFALLECTTKEIACALQSIFIQGAIVEQYPRVSLSQKVKSKEQPKIDIKRCLFLLNHHCEIDAPILKQLMAAVLNVASTQGSYQQLCQWIFTFKEILALFGFPGERTLNSIEHQVVKRMDELFNELMLLDSVLPASTAFEAIKLLEKVAANIPFQAQNKGAPIQILGLIEAIGQTFDNVWVMGMDSEAWPPMPNPNPFINIHVQRKLNMPHASASKELSYASKVTARFKEAAPNIIFSHTQSDKEKSLTVSELIQDIPLLTEALEVTQQNCESTFLQQNQLETYCDEVAPAINNTQTIKGTETTLRLQALCPFKAFAQQRLGLVQREEPSIWLAPFEQGNIVHDILAHFWQHFKNSECVNQSSSETIIQFLESTIDKSLKKYISAQMPSTYIAVEKREY